MIISGGQYPAFKLIHRCCEEYSDNIAFAAKSGKSRITYHEAEEQFCALTRLFYDIGCKGRHVALIGKNSLEYAIVLLSALCADLTLIPIDHSLNRDEILKRVSLCDADFVFCDKDQTRLFASEAAGHIRAQEPHYEPGIPADRLFTLDELMERAVENRKDNSAYQTVPPDEISGEHVCLMLFSSGTGGRIKLAELTQMNMTSEWNVVKNYDKVLGRALIIAPLCHILGLTDLLGNFYMGKSIYISDGFANFPEEMSYVRPSCMRMVPASARWLARLLQDVPEELRTTYTGGELKNIRVSGAPLDADVQTILTTYGINVVSDYGMTETAGPISVACAEGDVLSAPPDTVGKVIDGMHIFVKPISGYDYGEIVVSGNGVFKGYYKEEEATKEALRQGLLYTGDLGWLDKEGFLHLTGRSNNVIILPSGENVIPEAIEKELSENPLIKECVVYNEADELWVSIVPESGYEENEREITDYIRSYNRSHPVFMKIQHICFAGSLEKTGSGKIIRQRAGMRNDTEA